MRKPSEQGRVPFYKLVAVTSPMLFFKALDVNKQVKPVYPAHALIATAVATGAFLYSGYQVGQIAGEVDADRKKHTRAISRSTGEVE